MTIKRLPEAWVRKLFAELQGNYGSRFVDMWRSGQTLADGTDTGMKNALQLWSERLAGFADQPERIRKAMAALPPHPPSLPEFVALCRQQSIDTTRAIKKEATVLAAEKPTVAPCPANARNAAFVRRFSKRLFTSAGNMLSWAEKPPKPTLRAPWARAIVECARRGDPRFIQLLSRHIAEGSIKHSEAVGDAEPDDEN